MDNNNNPLFQFNILDEKIYYTIIGLEDDLKELLLNCHPPHNKIYILSKLSVPLVNIIDKEMENRKINIIIANDMEHLQCSILCDCNYKEEKKFFSLMYIEKNHNITNDVQDYIYTLKYPEILIKGNIDPNKYINDELKKIFPSYAKKLENNIKLIDIAGSSSNILIYCIRLSIK